MKYHCKKLFYMNFITYFFKGTFSDNTHITDRCTSFDAVWDTGMCYMKCLLLIHCYYHKNPVNKDPCFSS